jgi:hypothetical protein
MNFDGLTGGIQDPVQVGPTSGGHTFHSTFDNPFGRRRVNMLEPQRRYGKRSELRNKLLVDDRTLSRFRAATDLPPSGEPILSELLKRDGRWPRIGSLIDGFEDFVEPGLRFLNFPSHCWAPEGSR